MAIIASYSEPMLTLSLLHHNIGEAKPGLSNRGGAKVGTCPGGGVVRIRGHQ